MRSSLEYTMNGNETRTVNHLNDSSREFCHLVQSQQSLACPNCSFCLLSLLLT